MPDKNHICEPVEIIELFKSLEIHSFYTHLVSKCGYLPASIALGLSDIDGVSETGGFLAFHPNYSFEATELVKLQSIATAMFSNGDSIVWLENKGIGQKNPDCIFNGLVADMKGIGKKELPSNKIKNSIENGIKSAKEQNAQSVLFIIDENDFARYDLISKKGDLKKILNGKREAQAEISLKENKEQFYIFCYFFGEKI